MLADELKKIDNPLINFILPIGLQWISKKINPGFPRLAKNTPLTIGTEKYSVVRSQLDGESDLIHIALTASHEGAWVFTPIDSVWYNVLDAHKETLKDGVAIYSAEAKFELFNFSKNMFRYHNHPRKFGEVYLNNFSNQIDPSIKRKFGNVPENVRKSILTAAIYTNFTLPSTLDFAADGALDSPEEVFVDCIASPMGITTWKQKNFAQDFMGEYEYFLKFDATRVIVDDCIDLLDARESGAKLSFNFDRLFNSVNRRFNGVTDLSFSHRANGKHRAY
ncbi:MAG: hypothetical protein WCK90_01445 [archaeon]